MFLDKRRRHETKVSYGSKKRAIIYLITLFPLSGVFYKTILFLGKLSNLVAHVYVFCTASQKYLIHYHVC